MNLADFAKANPRLRGSPCWVCRLPAEVVAELHKGRAAGVSITTMMRWLKDEKKMAEATAAKLRGHFERHGGQ